MYRFHSILPVRAFSATTLPRKVTGPLTPSALEETPAYATPFEMTGELVMMAVGSESTRVRHSGPPVRALMPSM